MSTSALWQGVAHACNHALQHDWQAWQRLQTLSGQVMRVHLTDVNYSVECSVSAAGLVVQPGSAEPVDTEITATVRLLLQTLMRNKPGLPAGMVLRGNIQVAQTWQHVMRDLDIDWAAVLAPLCGDSVATLVAQAGKSWLEWGRQTVRHRLLDMGEYAQDEAQLLVSPVEVEDFYDAVDVLRDDAMRLMAQWQRRQQSDAGHTVRGEG